MSLYTHFLRSLALPVGETIAGYGQVMPYLRGLEASQWWSPEHVRQLQNQKLRRLIAHVYTNVPFYRDVMDERGLKPDDIQTTDDLPLLPIVDKSVINRHYQDALRDHSLPHDQLIPAASSGSTAERLHYWTTKTQKAKKWAGLFRWWEMAGYRFGDRYTTFTMAGNRGLRGFPLLDKLEWMMLRHRWLPAQNLAEDVLAAHARQLAHDRPSMLRSYASTLYYLAAYMNREELSVSVPVVMSTGEMLTAHMRETIEHAFRPGRVFDEYGGDGMQIACECDHHTGLHINAESYVIEIVRDGRRVPAGELGEVVLTNLEATAVPFLRYNIRDVACLDPTPCPCGRGLPRLGHLEGRLTDLFLTADGHWLSAHQFTGFFASRLPSVRAFQVIQRQVDDVLVRLVVDESFGQAQRRLIDETFRGFMGPDLRCTLELVDAIPTTPAGKRRFFISEVITGTESEA